MSWLAGLEERARAVLPRHVYDYVATGSAGNATRDEAVSAWSAVRFLPQVLRDVSSVSLTTTFLGRELAVPWGVAPSSAQREVHPDGEPGMLRASAAAGALTVVSSNAGTAFAELGSGPWWLQIYLPADRRLAEPLLERAVAAGASALVLTVDTPVVAAKPTESSFWSLANPSWVRVNFEDGYDERPGSHKATDLGPHDIEWLAGVSGLPVVAKGVLRPDDARRCLDSGAAAVWVSNHGGRQLDRSAATAAALPAVLDAVGGATEVYVDGGIRTGLDVLAALALGADAVFLGRLPVWALVEGQAGVARMHADLRTELEEAAPAERLPDAGRGARNRRARLGSVGLLLVPENRRPQRPTGQKPAGGGAGRSGPGQRAGGQRDGGQRDGGQRGKPTGRSERGGPERRGPERRGPERRGPARDERSPGVPRTKDQSEYDGPELPEGVTGAELDRSVTAQLKGLPEKLAARVARHLAAAGLYIDQDPDLAYRHALAARARAPRLAVVREAVGEAAYASGHYAEALADLRAAKRMNGATGYLPIMADCHRALGHPDQAVKLAHSPSVDDFPSAAKAEMTIVEAGARRDMGQLDAALRVLEQAPLTSKSRESWVVRLRYAYADALEAAGRPVEALSWFHRTEAIDAEEITDAGERAKTLERTLD